ncbi:MAG: type IV secretory system conjugative DNA transfer family protein [Planctomycetes bacterium]|nr:type IV secretory system conjugative DNA transfer family protein [Planctomycetota bacterium]
MRLWPKRRRDARQQWDLSTPLLSLSQSDHWTIRDSYAGMLILGATGSGKSSSSGSLLARSMLAAGYGMLVLVAKPEEREIWTRYCEETGRLGDLLFFSADGNLRFNFLAYEQEHAAFGAGISANIVQLLSQILEVAERGTSGSGGKEDEGFWRRACLQLMTNACDLQVIAGEPVSVTGLHKIVSSAPLSLEQLRSPAWQAESECFALLQRADKAAKPEIQAADFQMVTDYFCLEYPSLSDRTRSTIVTTFTSLTQTLARGLLRQLFCTDTNVTPEVVAEGKVLVIDLPVLGFNETGQLAQLIFKQCFQRAIERRKVTEETRPICLYMDEAQYFVTSQDARFASTCRSARVATVMVSQSTSAFDAALGGGDKGKAEAASLFGNLTTKIFHANGDPVTNQWASGLVGRSRQHFANSSSSQSSHDWAAAALGYAEAGQQSAGFSESYELEIQPTEFAALRTGGPEHDFLVDAVVFQSGRTFKATKKCWMPVTFEQWRGGR